VNIWTILNETGETLSVHRGNTLRKSKFSGHKDRHSNLVCSDHRVRWNNRSAAIVNTLTHHLHPKHTLLPFKELSNALLLLIGCFLSHRCIHKDIDSILQHYPLLSGVAHNLFTVLILGCFRIYLLDQGLRQGDVC
jgi:hypothetical protein